MRLLATVRRRKEEGGGAEEEEEEEEAEEEEDLATLMWLCGLWQVKVAALQRVSPWLDGSLAVTSTHRTCVPTFSL